MPLDLISNLISLYFNDRIEALAEYANNSADIQSEQLFNLLREAELTEFGKEHDFANIFSYQDFREKVPVSNKHSISKDLERIENGESNILWPGIPKSILTSFSGTKIPVSIQSLEENFNQGLYDLYVTYLKNNPDSNLFSGYFLTVGHEGENEVIDNISKLIRQNEVFLFSLLNLPKNLDIRDLDEDGLKGFIEEISNERISCFKGSPKSLNKFLNLSDKNISDEAEVLFYKTATASSVDDTISGIKIVKYYCTPEGFFGIQDKENEDTFLLMIDLSIFYEFIDTTSEEVLPIPLEDIETGKSYQMLITNSSGLWRYYSDGPKIKFVSKSPFRFILTD